MIQAWILSSAFVCPENISALFWYQHPIVRVPVAAPKAETIEVIATPVTAAPVDVIVVETIEKKEE